MGGNSSLGTWKLKAYRTVILTLVVLVDACTYLPLQFFSIFYSSLSSNATVSHTLFIAVFFVYTCIMSRAWQSVGRWWVEEYFREPNRKWPHYDWVHLSLFQMHLAFYIYYRNFFVHVDNALTAAVFLLLHLITDIVVYPFRMSELWQRISLRIQCVPVVGRLLQPSTSRELFVDLLVAEYYFRKIAEVLSLLSFLLFTTQLS
eukprot:NODE_687_length_1511_cov_112.909029_g566_i0.p1 GENE.NODE_687_length_1511_cov_112.909029_g566_i0~~NODE_687_length_1511_cov_112.909029_g566_i0.p1  ORF type:complete len:203 (+),score=41.96 NODE_687_length_1511_cov_112.909029_g566_i0:491-1099(+)